MSPTVLGLDLSLTATALSDGQRTWLVKSTGHRGDTLAIRSTRLSQLRTAVLEQAHGADLVVVEGPSHGQARQGGQHDRAGLWWHVVGALLDTGAPVAEVPPATLKRYATGKGNAGKGAVIEATTRRYPQVLTDGDDNRCDGLWLAVMGLDYLTGSSAVPEAHRAALSAVVWPLAGAA